MGKPYHKIPKPGKTFSSCKPTNILDFAKRALRLIERHKQALARFLKESCADLLPRVAVHQKVNLGTPGKSIVAASKCDAVDMVVISTHGRTGLSHILLGSVTEKLVREANRSVLSIRPGVLKEGKIANPAWRGVTSHRTFLPAFLVLGTKHGKTSKSRNPHRAIAMFPQ